MNSWLIILYPALLLSFGYVSILQSPPESGAAAFYVLQALLYLVPLAGFLVGTGSAHGDRDEMELIRAQPVRPFLWIAGKFVSLTVLFAVCLLLLVAPPYRDLGWALSVKLWAYGAGIGALALALGMALGMWLTDAVKAHLASLCVWLLLTFGFSAAGWVLAGTEFAQGQASLWAGLLMISPLESLRVGLLFDLETTPFAGETAPRLVRLWLDYSGYWFALITAIWIAVALSCASRSTRHF